jgi:hypothetical protein
MSWSCPDCHNQVLQALCETGNSFIELLETFERAVTGLVVAEQPDSTVEAYRTLLDAIKDHTETYYPLLGIFERAKQVVYRDFVARATRANTAQTLGPFELPAQALPLPPAAPALHPSDTNRQGQREGAPPPASAIRPQDATEPTTLQAELWSAQNAGPASLTAEEH